MSIWIIVQIVVNIVIGLSFFALWQRLKRPPQEDPRLSRGLQLLQSKISVLEDLSDRTEIQVKQLNSLLEQKVIQVQKKIQNAEVMVGKIDQSMNKSMEVAEIFQDKIPHEEIIERQNTVKYVTAARMAHSGSDVNEIAQKVDLPIAEIEFVAKVNREELQFDETQLPEWLQRRAEETAQQEVNFVEEADAVPVDYTTAFARPTQVGEENLKKLGEEFRKACEAHNLQEQEREEREARVEEQKQKIVDKTKEVTAKIRESAQEILQEASEKVSAAAKKTGMNIEFDDQPQVVTKPEPRWVQEAKAKLNSDGPKVKVVQQNPTIERRAGVEPVDFPTATIDKPDLNDNLG